MAAKTKNPLNFAVAENIAAISMEMAKSRQFEEAYRVALHDVGFPQFYQIAIEAGIALERVSEKKNITWGEDADWILTTSAYAEAILQHMVDNGTPPHGARYEEIAVSAVVRF